MDKPHAGCFQVRLCALEGDIFPAEDREQRASLGLQGQTTREAYLARVLLAALTAVLPPEQAVRQALAGDEDTLLDACR